MSMFDRKLRVDLPFLDDTIAFHATNFSSKYPVFIPARSKNSQEVSDASCDSRIGVSGQLPSIQMRGVGEWQNDVGADLRSERRPILHFRGAGARPMDS